MFCKKARLFSHVAQLFFSVPGHTVQYSRWHYVPSWFASCRYTHRQEKTTSSARQLLLIFIPVQLVFLSTDSGRHRITTTVFFCLFCFVWGFSGDLSMVYSTFTLRQLEWAPALPQPQVRDKRFCIQSFPSIVQLLCCSHKKHKNASIKTLNNSVFVHRIKSRLHALISPYSKNSFHLLACPV